MDAGAPKAPEACVCPEIPPEVAHRIVELIGGVAAEREQAYTKLLALERDANGPLAAGRPVQPDSARILDHRAHDSLVSIAVACASPLCAVLCKPASEVSVEEYRRAALVLAAISGGTARFADSVTPPPAPPRTTVHAPHAGHAPTYTRRWMF